MKFYPLSNELAADVLAAGYQAGREIGKVRLGEQCLYFREKLKVYYIPYADMTRVFRRVMLIPATMCCGKGDFEVENIVISTAEGAAVAASSAAKQGIAIRQSTETIDKILFFIMILRGYYKYSII